MLFRSSLFSVGLRQSSLATSDTAQAAFADSVLNAMHANAATVTNWSDWAGSFSNLVMDGITMPGTDSASAPTYPAKIFADGTTHTLRNYLITGHTVVYRLNLIHSETPSIWLARMQAIDNGYMSVSNSPVYATAFVFMGM